MKYFVILLYLLPSVTLSGELLRFETSVSAMGTAFSVVVHGEDRSLMIDAVEAASQEVYRLDRLLSNYRADSEWSHVNRYAAERPVQVTPELFQLLEACLRFGRESEGAFDITVGPLMKVWGFYRGTGHLPRREEIAEALTFVGNRNVFLDPATSTVRFAKAGVGMDPGGIGKGYAVDRMIEILREKGIRSALITAGGSSIYGMGAPPNQDGWKVSIRNPKSPRAKIEEIRLRDESLSTSGTYEKFFVAEGKTYSHIMDPRTGYPAPGMLSVSVIAERTLDSEAWTKPFFVLGKEWAARHKPSGIRVFLCENRSELACEWLQ